jgi:hypothetical protein
MRKLVICGLFVSILLTACNTNNQPGSLEGRQIADLEARVAALEAQLAAVPAPAAQGLVEGAGDDAFGVVVAQYVMDTAGFHGMDEALNETKTVDPAYLSTVNRVRKVVAEAPWPDALHEQAEAVEAVLAGLAAVLEADDGEGAAALAAELHTAQHDLSHAIDNWLAGGDGEQGDHGG